MGDLSHEVERGRRVGIEVSRFEPHRQAFVGGHRRGVDESLDVGAEHEHRVGVQIAGDRRQFVAHEVGAPQRPVGVEIDTPPTQPSPSGAGHGPEPRPDDHSSAGGDTADQKRSAIEFHDLNVYRYGEGLSSGGRVTPPPLRDGVVDVCFSYGERSRVELP